MHVQISSEVSRHKLNQFRKLVDDYMRHNLAEWVDLLSLQVADVQRGSTNLVLRARHRHPVDKIRAIGLSVSGLRHVCHQIDTYLDMAAGAPATTTKNIDMEYNDDLSADSMGEMDNELYFLANTTQ